MNTVSDRLPAGFVTFVFTDIEGSTPMLKRLGDEYATVSEHHDALLADAFVSAETDTPCHDFVNCVRTDVGSARHAVSAEYVPA